jgi:hypothetical protein
MLKNLVGNYLMGGTYTVESPQYATVQSGLDSNLNLDTAGYVAQNPNAQYIVAGYGALANSGRQTLPMGGINNWDMNLKKVFSIKESKRIEFAAEFYNMFNHPQYTPGYLNNVQFHNSNDTRVNLIPGNPSFNRPDLVFDSNSRTISLVARFQF